MQFIWFLIGLIFVSPFAFSETPVTESPDAFFDNRFEVMHQGGSLDWGRAIGGDDLDRIDKCRSAVAENYSEIFSSTISSISDYKINIAKGEKNIIVRFAPKIPQLGGGVFCFIEKETGSLLSVEFDY